MQEASTRSNKVRSDATRLALIRAARTPFVAKGYAATGTPEIVNAAGVTRGALYHHFADKEALFDAVVMAEAEAVAAEIRAGDDPDLDPLDALIQGGRAFLAAMRVTGRTRLLLIDAPAVLGLHRLADIDAASGGQTLAEGIAAAQRVGVLLPCPVRPMAQILSAAYDRAALAMDAGEAEDDWHAVLDLMIRGLAKR